MMRKNRALFSAKYQEYITPKDLYKKLDDKFHFVLDPCTTKDNPLNAPKFFTKEDDGLSKSWKPGPVFVNPPYKDVKKWVYKAWSESLKGVTSVMLLAARTDTQWFHQWIWVENRPRFSVDIEFIRGRLKFEGVVKNTAPFPSMIVTFNAL